MLPAMTSHSTTASELRAFLEPLQPPAGPDAERGERVPLPKQRLVLDLATGALSWNSPSQESAWKYTADLSIVLRALTAKVNSASEGLSSLPASENKEQLQLLILKIRTAVITCVINHDNRNHHFWKVCYTYVRRPELMRVCELFGTHMNQLQDKIKDLPIVSAPPPPQAPQLGFKSKRLATELDRKEAQEEGEEDPDGVRAAAAQPKNPGKPIPKQGIPVNLATLQNTRNNLASVDKSKVR